MKGGSEGKGRSVLTQTNALRAANAHMAFNLTWSHHGLVFNMQRQMFTVNTKNAEVSTIEKLIRDL